MNTYSSSARRLYRDWDEAIRREIVEPVRAAGVAELTGAQVEDIAHRVIVTIRRPNGVRYALNPHTDGVRLRRIVCEIV